MSKKKATLVIYLNPNRTFAVNIPHHKILSKLFFKIFDIQLWDKQEAPYELEIKDMP